MDFVVLGCLIWIFGTHLLTWISWKSKDFGLGFQTAFQQFWNGHISVILYYVFRQDSFVTTYQNINWLWQTLNLLNILKYQIFRWSNSYVKKNQEYPSHFCANWPSSLVNSKIVCTPKNSFKFVFVFYYQKMFGFHIGFIYLHTMV